MIYERTEVADTSGSPDFAQRYATVNGCEKGIH